MFDIEKFDTRTRSEAGAEMVVRNPTSGVPFRTEDGKEVTITLFGRNSSAFRVAEREVRARALIRSKAKVDVTEEETQQDLVEFLCAMTRDWSGLQRGGAEFPATPENIRLFWSDDRWGWLARQAEQFSMGEGNFLAN